MRALSRKGGVTAALFLSAALTFTACGKSSAPPASGKRPAPDFSLRDLSGKTVSLADYRGRVVLVDFWATWCAPCRISIPAMEDLHREYAPKGVQVLSVSLDEETDLIGPFAERYGMSYPVLLGAASDVAERYRVRGIPTLFLIDREGNLVRHWIGFDSDLPRQWRESLDQALGQSVT